LLQQKSNSIGKNDSVLDLVLFDEILVIRVILTKFAAKHLIMGMKLQLKHFRLFKNQHMKLKKRKRMVMALSVLRIFEMSYNYALNVMNQKAFHCK
jgi:hypothetical protein